MTARGLSPAAGRLRRRAGRVAIARVVIVGARAPNVIRFAQRKFRALVGGSRIGHSTNRPQRDVVRLTLLCARVYAAVTSCNARCPMNSLTEAHDRLAKAVEHLERVSGEAPMARDVEAELVALRDRCRTLEGRNAEVSRRLDAAIDRLRTVLAQ